MTKANIVELDAEGIRVRALKDNDGNPEIVLGGYDIVIDSAEQAQALIDGIWKAGVPCKWTLHNPMKAK